MKKIHSQLSIVFVGLYLLCSLVLLLTAENLLQKNLRNRLIDNMERQCLLIDAQFLPQKDSLPALSRRISKSVDGRLSIIDADGVVVADSQFDIATTPLDNHLYRPEVQQALKSPRRFGSALRYSATAERELLYAAYYSPNGHILRIAHTLDVIDNDVFKIRFILVLATVVSTLIALLLVVRTSRYLTNPLLNIIEATRRIGDGQYQEEIETSSTNEIGTLATSINTMARKLKAHMNKYEVIQGVRRDFIANASHELKTPVSSIKGYIETLLDGALADPNVNQRFLERALSNVERLEIIVNDMLDLSRLESYNQKKDERYIKLSEYLQNTIDDLQGKARKKGLELTYEDKLPPNFRLLVDSYHLDKAVINVTENAVKYTEGGFVKVTALTEDDNCKLIIEDSGRGISKEDIPRIFERFYRVDKARSRDLGGSGLGLAIVKHVMELYNGTVNVDSELGKGTTFTLIFPM